MPKKVFITRKTHLPDPTEPKLNEQNPSEQSDVLSLSREDSTNTPKTNIPDIKDHQPQQINKLKLNKSILLIDTSYWVYYRFFALRNWYKKAYPDIDTTVETFNWLEDKTFMEKYEKTFLEGINTICNMWNIPLCNVVFCIDCPYKTIWRYEHHTEYKGTRLDTHKRNGFNSFAIFDTVKQILIPKLVTKYKMNSIMVDKCEADDIVGNLSMYLADKIISNSSDAQPNTDIKQNVNICILASDNDYIQICTDNIILVDGVGKQLCENKKAQGGEKYLVKKILSGDVSDNIDSCYVCCDYLVEHCGVKSVGKEEFKKCTPAIIEKMVTNDESYSIIIGFITKMRKKEHIVAEDILKVFKDVEQFTKNVLIIDFKMIPIELKSNLLAKFEMVV